VSRGSSESRQAARRLATLLGLVALLLGAVVLAAVVGAFAASHCGAGGEARTGRLAMSHDAARRDAPAPAPRERGARRPAAPVRLEIRAIGVNAPVARLGLNRDRTLQVPTDFDEAGWWTGGPRPGERGPAIIAGHVDSYTGPAVFFRIRELHPGDTIVVARRDRTGARFVVLRSEEYPKSRFPTERVYGGTTRPELRLITCSGEFDRASGHYLDNTVVYAAAV
jgi:sortase (surface protein transpeptidase)